MFDNFIKNVTSAYDLILQPSDILYKKKELNCLKTQIGIDEFQGYGTFFYEYLKEEKRSGVVYTPIEIADYIIKDTIGEEDVIKNPYIKIIDPACGAGNLLIPCFHYLKKLFKENLKCINKIHNINLKEEDIDHHIVRNNLYGSDIDELSIKVLSIDLFSEANYLAPQNIRVNDFLIENDFQGKYDIFIGNPPYIGHKSVDREYSLLLKKEFAGIYKDKGDMSYCFFKKALDLAGRGGKISFITSRYFMEAPSGLELRKMINENSFVRKIFDFYGIRPFKEAKVDPVIVFLECDSPKRKTQIIRPSKDYDYKGISAFKLKEISNNESVRFEIYNVERSSLKEDGWTILNSFEQTIVDKIETKCTATLQDICMSNQGIITGCDSAFIVTNEVIENEKLEMEIIKPWLKGRDIKRFRVDNASKFLIYSNLIDKEENYPNIIRHISKYKEKLLTRRECSKGLRKWYELQWGRRKELFTGEKIIFPYKASDNRFALDEGSFFSADIYSIMLKDFRFTNYTALLQLLNSSIYEFYFKTFAKKLGDSMYEYYPNTVMKLKLPDMKIFNNINDNILFDYFKFDEKERKYIEELYGKC